MFYDRFSYRTHVVTWSKSEITVLHVDCGMLSNHAMTLGFGGKITQRAKLVT